MMAEELLEELRPAGNKLRLRAAGIEPVELLRIALKPQPGHRSPLLRRIEALLPYTEAEAAPAGVV